MTLDPDFLIFTNSRVNFSCVCGRLAGFFEKLFTCFFFFCGLG